MKIKRFIGSDSRTAMRLVKEALGPDAIILSNRKVPDGVEILAAEDFDDELLSSGEVDLGEAVSEAQHTPPQRQSVAAPAPVAAVADAAPSQRPVRVEIIESPTSASAEPSDRRTQSESLGGISQKKNDWLKTVAMYANSARSQVAGKGKPASENGIPARNGSFSDAMREQIPELNQTVNRDALASAPITEKLTPRPAPAPVAAKAAEPEEDSPSVRGMRDELMQLRGMMESQLSSMNMGLWSHSSPSRVAIHKQLQQLGITEVLATKVVAALKDVDNMAPLQAVRTALAAIARNLPMGPQNLMERGGTVVLLGPAGAGKTTTIAKLALQFTQQHSPGDVVLISTDNSRVGAHEQLAGFGKLLGVPVLRAIDPVQIQEMIRAMQDKKLVLVDTGSLTQQDIREPRRIATMNMELPIEHYLVMPATTQFQTLNRIISGMPKGSLKAGIISKVDEASNLGEVLSASIMNRFPLSYWTEKQTITSKLNTTNQRQLVELAVAMLKDRQSNTPMNGAMDFSAPQTSNGFNFQ